MIWQQTIEMQQTLLNYWQVTESTKKNSMNDSFIEPPTQGIVVPTTETTQRPIPRPKARVWLPNLDIETTKLLRCLKLLNPEITIENWVVLHRKLPQKSIQLFLFTNCALSR